MSTHAVDIRDHRTFADFAVAVYERHRPTRETGSAYGDDKGLICSLAKRYAVQVLGEEAEHIGTWTATPLTTPRQASVRLDGTDHRLHYKPHDLTGDYELVLERYCRLHGTTDMISVHSLAELGALLEGRDNRL